MKLLRLLLGLIISCITFINVYSQKLRVLSYNIHHGANTMEKNTLDSMGFFIKEMNPDLVGLQEVDSMCERTGKTDQMKRLATITGMHYAFVRHFPYQGGAYGLGILSRYPVKKVERKKLQLLKKGPNSDTVAMLFATIQVSKKKQILFVTAHFSAFDKASRRSQVEQTLKYLSDEHLPIIFTGDLNATSDTEEIQLLQQYLYSIDKQGIYTFPDSHPDKKIDYILISPGALRHLKKIEAIPVHFSDHLPLMTDIAIDILY